MIYLSLPLQCISFLFARFLQDNLSDHGDRSNMFKVFLLWYLFTYVFKIIVTEDVWNLFWFAFGGYVSG